MKQNDLDKTQLMPQLKESDTQPLPRVTEDTETIQPAFPQQMSKTEKPAGVRELPPEPALPRKEQVSSGTIFTPGRKRGLILAISFAVALLGGFLLAGYSQDQSEARQNQHAMEQQQFREREQKLADQEADLKARRQELERQKQELQSRERELEAQSSRAKGRNEAIQENMPDSAFGKLMDRVTGKEAKRKEQIQENEKVSAQADSDVAKLKQSIAEAQNMLDDVDAKLDTVAEMQQEASRIKAKAESAYVENKDVIDKAVHYVQIGADVLSDWLTTK
ncbi:hypothetical protein SAMN05216582_12545 [Selenomonas ruminantium]|uniref:Uncharacterized protein n=1 Tax=Selenomonas ruminantium TaxID=971 RepID=A0A1M6WIV2_SELRU|nr:hypothetical protein [Selenomonas ruminantium]SHK93680.1 hypothetical protein SAMN05216582_12545 [Selenomonas ruminantium]